MARLLSLLMLFAFSSLSATSLLGQTRELIVLCYNVENLCDTIDNPLTQDEEFTPEGSKRWTGYRYRKKLRQIAEVISRAGDAHWPALVGLVEVESEEAVSDLLRLTPLGRKGYSYTMTRLSPDPRGMNVALLHRAPLSLVAHEEFVIPFADGQKQSRNILYARYAVGDKAQLNVLLAHLPSRRGGARLTEGYRREGATKLRAIADSLYRADEGWLIMGDMNGDPEERATAVDLGARLERPTEQSLSEGASLQLYNVTSSIWMGKAKPYGSYCYRGVWSQLDQLILSGNLLSGELPLSYVEGSVEVYAPEWLSSGREQAGRQPPARSYAGSYYKGGYSDHFPVMLRLRYAQ